jgi:hypothetical protein
VLTIKVQASDALGWMPRLAIVVGIVTMPAVGIAQETQVFFGSVPVATLIMKAQG